MAVATSQKKKKTHRFNPQKPKKYGTPIASTECESAREREEEKLLLIQLNDVIITCDSLTRRHTNTSTRSDIKKVSERVKREGSFMEIKLEV